jgi:Flp pilus assembly protein TadG
MPDMSRGTNHTRSLLPWPLAARSTRGQSLVEFALILPILLMLVGGIIQYGVIFATKHALIQVARDTGRWAATQKVDAPGDCLSAATASPPQPVTEADLLARESRLMGYANDEWNAANFTAYPNDSSLPATPPKAEGVEVVWSGQLCPTSDSTQVAWVTIRLTHRAPVFLPGFAYLPGLGTCDTNGCYLPITTTARFRMEPQAAP